MADKNNKKGGGVFGFFKKKPSKSAGQKPPKEASAPQSSLNKEKEVNEVPEIAQLLITILEEKLPVQVFLGDSTLPYYSFFEWELVENREGKVLDSKENLENGDYLLLAALDPPIGNIKVRTATEIRVEFFTRFHLYECFVTLRQITGTKKLCFEFPKQLKQKPQNRSSFRAPIERNQAITASIIRPSGISLNAKLADISVGGAAFYPTGATPRISDHSRIGMEITFPEGSVSVDAVVLGSFAKEGEHFFRAQFLIANQRTASDIGEFVAYIQRESTQKRIQTFS